MSIANGRPWVVLKFGGTSVSTLERWQTIASVVRERIDEGLRPLVVCSALSGVTNDLERLLKDAVQGQHQTVLSALEAKHHELAAALEVPVDPTISAELESLSRLLLGLSLIREASPRLHARVLAHGEILATR